MTGLPERARAAAPLRLSLDRDERPRSGRKYTLELTTIPAIADSDYLDRLAELVYELDEVADPLLGLAEDGSASAGFTITARSPSELLERARRAAGAVHRAIVEARPLRPYEAEGGDPLADVKLNPADDREVARA